MRGIVILFYQWVYCYMTPGGLTGSSLQLFQTNALGGMAFEEHPESVE
jgi:hypothetical protein